VSDSYATPAHSPRRRCRSDSFVDDALAQLSDPHAHRLTVFVFERFDESLILMLNQLNLTIDEVHLGGSGISPSLVTVMCTTIEQQPCSTRFIFEQVEQWGSVWGHVCKWAGSVCGVGHDDNCC